MEKKLTFSTREDFRAWLEENGRKSGGVWLVFGKAGGPETLSANEALEEALCYGWIDGQMKKIDEKSYCKYFAARRPNSKWSLRNKQLAEKLISENKMHEDGIKQVALAKENGQWQKATKPSAISPEQIATVAQLLQANPLAYENFVKMPSSIQKTYTRAYFDAKTPAGQQKRLAWLSARLEKNLKPM